VNERFVRYFLEGQSHMQVERLGRTDLTASSRADLISERLEVSTMTVGKGSDWRDEEGDMTVSMPAILPCCFDF
jgi:hypothetical protein